MTRFVSTSLTQIVRRVWGYDDIECASEFEQDVNLKEQAETDKIRVSIGASSINEARERSGLEGIPGGERYYLETTAGVFEVTKDGLVSAQAAPASPNPMLPGEKPGQRLIGDGNEPPANEPAKKRHYDPSNPHVILDRLSRLEKKAQAGA
jgi:hypothetical protein